MNSSAFCRAGRSLGMVPPGSAVGGEVIAEDHPPLLVSRLDTALGGELLGLPRADIRALQAILHVLQLGPFEQVLAQVIAVAGRVGDNGSDCGARLVEDEADARRVVVDP